MLGLVRIACEVSLNGSYPLTPIKLLNGRMGGENHGATGTCLEDLLK